MITSNVRFTYKQSDTLNGAFTYLQKKFNTINIHEKIVKINSSSSEKNLYIPVTNRDCVTDIYWNSKNENGSWYEVDFQQNLFYLTNYFIRAAAHDFFSKWQVLGSNDGVNYDVVDDVTDFKEPTTDNLVFKCKYPKVRKIYRIVTNGKRFAGDYIFHMHRLEFYGSFVSSPFVKTCKINHMNKLYYVF